MSETTDLSPDDDIVRAVRAEIDAADIGCWRDVDEENIHRYGWRMARIRAERERIKAWYEQSMKRLDSQERATDFLLGDIVRDAVRRKLAGGKAKTLHTPYGDFGFRAQKELLVVEDENALKEACFHDCDMQSFLREVTSYSIDKEYLDAHYDKTGEIPPGCTVRPAGEKFFVK